MRIWPVIGGGDVFDAVGVGAELVTFFETDALGIVGVVNGDGLAAVLFHDGEAGHVGRAVADVDHVRERDGANIGVHVVVDVLGHVEQAFVDPEEKLRLLRVTDYALRKGDPAFVVLGKFAAKNRAHVGLKAAAIEQHL